MFSWFFEESKEKKPEQQEEEEEKNEEIKTPKQRKTRIQQRKSKAVKVNVAAAKTRRQRK